MRSAFLVAAVAACASALRPPAVPLSPNHPFFSIWSASNNLYDAPTVWGPNGDVTELAGIVIVDGVAYRFMGGPEQKRAVFQNSSFPYFSYNSDQNVPTWQACENWCNGTEICLSWNFQVQGNKTNCWLNKMVGPAVADPTMVSGTVAKSYFTPQSTVEQESVVVTPLQTIYTFNVGTLVKFTVTWATAHIPTDWETMSKPVTYITYGVSSRDGKSHNVKIYLDTTAQVVTASDDVEVVWAEGTATANGENIVWLNLGAQSQQLITTVGGDDRISYGYVYLAALSNAAGLETVIHRADVARVQFVNTGTLPSANWNAASGSVENGNPVLAVVVGFNVSSATPTTQTILIGNDPVTAVDYFNMMLLPYWNRNQIGAPAMLASALTNASVVLAECNAFDADLMSRLEAVGGDTYATVCALAYRQSYASTMMTWNYEREEMWQFLKEISSGSDMSTVDVIFPAAPLYLLENPELLWRLLVPLLEYANNETYIAYNLSWAPHHLGWYPLGNLEPYNQEQMPIEETGNLLIMIAAIANAKGNVDFIPERYWPLMDGWAQYLWNTTENPGNQLCTDDFEGPSPNNSNLAAKGMVGMAAYSVLLRLHGNDTGADTYLSQAQSYAQYWMVADSQNDHYGLMYNTNNTFSLKYNLLWQPMLNVPVFPQSVFDAENKYYMTKLNTYGVPLDNRATFTKTDWLMWVGGFEEYDNFQTITKSVYQMLDTTPDRVPLTDWYFTDTGRQTGFRCRAVVGGLFARLMLQESLALQAPAVAA